MHIEANTPLVICEGEQEMEIAFRICENSEIGKNIFRLDANGNSKYDVIAKKIIALIHSAEIPFSSIIVLFDREDNKDSPAQIINGVKTELKNLGHNLKHTIIGVADPYVESWMLPFVDREAKFPIIPTSGSDGIRSEGELKKRLKKRGIPYNKKKIGVEILNAIDPKTLAKVSNNFKEFYDQINKICNW